MCVLCVLLCRCSVVLGVLQGFLCECVVLCVLLCKCSIVLGVLQGVPCVCVWRVYCCVVALLYWACCRVLFVCVYCCVGVVL